jgi:hypothetical protein
MIDVTVSTATAATPEQVAQIMFDPRRDPEWIGGAKSAQQLPPGPYGVGTKVRREGAFLGRSLSWTTEVTEFAPERLIRMKHTAGPFRAASTIRSPRDQGSEITIRNYGEASFRFPFMATLMQTSVAADLRRLKALAERAR